jgi:type I restriction enzyme S subunit
MIGDGCKQTTLGSISVFLNGGAWNQTEYSEKGVPVVRVTDIKYETVDLTACKFLPKSSIGKYAKHLLRAGDLVICTVGSHPTQPGSVVGRAAVMPYAAHGALLNQNAVCIRSSSSDLDQRWLGYLGRSRKFHDYIISCARGSANQVRMAIGLLKEMPVQIPTPPVQRRVAGILSAYDELIENNQRRIRILEDMARSLYLEWFVHFRYPGHESISLVDSPFGQIPQGWEVKKLGDVADVSRGRSYRSVDLADDGGLPFLNLKCLDRDGGFRRTGLKRYTGEYKDIHVAKRGDIIMAVTDMTQERRIVARAALVPTMDNEFGIFSMDLVRIEPKLGLPKAFIYSFLRYSSFADEVKQHANGANVLHLSPDRITDFRFPVPTAELMSRFASFVAPILEEIDTLENKIDNLRRTRDLLLPRLLSGQINFQEESLWT